MTALLLLTQLAWQPRLGAPPFARRGAAAAMKEAWSPAGRKFHERDVPPPPPPWFDAATSAVARAVSLHQKAAEIGADIGSKAADVTSTTANIAAKLGIEIEGPDVSGAVSKATEEVAEGVQSFFRTAADEDARRQKLIDGMYANSAAPIILDEYDGGADGVGVEEIAVGEEVARDVLRPVDSAYLVGRDALVGEVDSSALLDRDEAAGLWPLGLDRSASAVQLPFVYEPDCIGCTWCASIARATFRMNGDDNKARCVQQGEDADAVEEAIEACPADCIHLVSRTQLAALEAQRHNGTVARLPEWKDQIIATNKRMGTTGSNDPTIRRQREESRRAAEL